MSEVITIMPFTDAGVGMFMIILGFLFIIVVLWAISTRRTKRYRIELADMYVSAKIRQIAEKEKINLSAEYINFQKWVKKRKMDENSYRFDDVVEEELKEKLVDEGQEKK